MKMKRIEYGILSLLLFSFSCNSNNSKIENDYVKSLEEKNKELEAELLEIKGKSQSLNNYFFVGSTIDEVIAVMGEPNSYMVTAPEARRFYYGLSAVYFYQGKVIAYDNIDDNLKVRLKR